MFPRLKLTSLETGIQGLFCGSCFLFLLKTNLPISPLFPNTVQESLLLTASNTVLKQRQR